MQNPRQVALTPLDTGAGSAFSGNYVWTGRYFDNLQTPNSGHGIGFIAQLHFYIDDIFPHSLGTPIFGGKK